MLNTVLFYRFYFSFYLSGDVNAMHDHNDNNNINTQNNIYSAIMYDVKPYATVHFGSPE